MQCGDLTRTCYASHDADAFCKEEGCEVYPWRDEVETQAPETSSSADAATPDAYSKTVSTTASGMVRAFLDAFIESHPYVPVSVC